ncbi:MAG: NUDIX hydrolase [Atribacterota bacterium]|nr:NUDIX hydrolase [Atribacterota bacterium]
MKVTDLKYCTKCGHALEKKLVKENERLCCTFCDTIYYDNPISSVAVVVRNEHGQLLLVKRKNEPKKGFWALPGGFIDNGESAIEAALREMKEETGLDGIIKRFVKIYNHESKKYGHVIIITYEVDIIGGELKAGDDAECAEFFDIEELPVLAFHYQEDILQKTIGCSAVKTKERITE